MPYARTQDLFVADSSNDACWRLADLNQDGDHNDPGEQLSFCSDTIGAFAWTNPKCVGSAADGAVYVADTTTDVVYALRDLNGDGDANDPGEAAMFWTPPVATTRSTGASPSTSRAGSTSPTTAPPRRSGAPRT